MTADFLKNYEFFVGVPDSLLKPFCDWVMDTHLIGKSHIVAANEGNAVALAAGYHLATGKVPVVYLQNSGQGNIINPLTSLMHPKVYGIPCIFVIGWRGEPEVCDEPQHIFQGDVTLKLLEDMEIETFVICKSTTLQEVEEKLQKWQSLLNQGKQVAFVVRKNALEYENHRKYQNDYKMSREDIIKRIVAASGNDRVVSTTGKASRELFEIREANNQGHGLDFLTVGSMGHTSSIALGIALQKPDKKVWCIDGDGSALMHMGGMAVVGANSPKNLVHIVINNESHETVGGMPTVAKAVDFVKIAEGCGYSYCACASSFDELDRQLFEIKNTNSLCFLEVKCSIGSRNNLGRPTTTAKQNKEDFMKNFI